MNDLKSGLDVELASDRSNSVNDSKFAASSEIQVRRGEGRLNIGSTQIASQTSNNHNYIQNAVQDLCPEYPDLLQ